MNFEEIREVATNVSVRVNKYLEKKQATELINRSGLCAPVIYNLKNNKPQSLTIRTLIKLAAAMGTQPHLLIKPVKRHG